MSSCLQKKSVDTTYTYEGYGDNLCTLYGLLTRTNNFKLPCYKLSVTTHWKKNTLNSEGTDSQRLIEICGCFINY